MSTDDAGAVEDAAWVAGEVRVVCTCGKPAPAAQDRALRAARRNELDSPRLRDLQIFYVEVEWAKDELFHAKSCEEATEHLRKAEEALNRLPPPQAEGQRPRLDYGAESVAAGCPIAVG